MMTTAAVIGLSTGKSLLSSSFYYSDLTEKFSHINDHGSPHYLVGPTKNAVAAKKSSNYSPSFPSSNRHTQSIKAVKEHVDANCASTAEAWLQRSDDLEEESSEFDYSVEALLLLQKSMLEKQWNLSFERTVLTDSSSKKTYKKIPVTCSGLSARQRRMNSKKKILCQSKSMIQQNGPNQLRSVISPELLQSRLKGYVKGVVSEELLTHAEVVRLSKKIKTGLSLEERKLRLKERLGCQPSDAQLAASLRISRTELQSTLIECSLAREKLVMSNVRLVMSIAQRYDNMGADMSDLVQGGLIGLLRGIEKFDSSKGFKISTYVYWWIRQGVSRALVENSRTLRLPNHLHERLGLIRNAKVRLEEKGVTPSIDRIAEYLNMSQKKVRNATEATSKVFSLDREAFPSLNGLPGETHHSYIADNRVENNPWHGVDEWALKDEVNRLITVTLGEREREIIRLYYGLDKECLTWEDISKRIGLSRERVRQVGLVALEKLKHAARKKKMEAMLVKH
ncbi:RNA polymerase sigma factor sigA isoform X2 [Pistacia vera]|uniref:RNA polymerase sigma factor sigA isoform X1 n=1 Tax=Pistacia vera TaxID=55513 RepID=UPI001262DD17|nr:RNA polymerase sigma factor sigA isoform X1 [Pistacia vera]XP_031276054.1 RNA polymerase sigma factor sigA isoform X2 [Pistacia vera]